MRPDRQIKKGRDELIKVMEGNLSDIAADIISKVMKKYRSLSNAKKLDATKDIKPKGINVYRSDLEAVISVISFEALGQARKEVPASKNIKLMENEESLMLGEFEKLPKSIRDRIKRSNQLLIGTQIADLEKSIYFQYNSAITSNLAEREIEERLEEKAEDYITSNSIKAGAAVNAANVVNEARSAFFFHKDVIKNIEALQFVNGDPVTPICSDLDGIIFSPQDPNAFKYTPPLHYNCKSYIQPVIKLKKGQEIKKIRPSTADLDDTIQFSDISEACGVTCQHSNFIRM